MVLEVASFNIFILQIQLQLHKDLPQRVGKWSISTLAFISGNTVTLEETVSHNKVGTEPEEVEAYYPPDSKWHQWLRSTALSKRGRNGKYVLENQQVEMIIESRIKGLLQIIEWSITTSTHYRLSIAVVRKNPFIRFITGEVQLHPLTIRVLISHRNVLKSCGNVYDSQSN